MKKKKAPKYLASERQKRREREIIINSYFEYTGSNIDTDSAIKADVSKQNFSTFPRGYYVDIGYQCRDCGKSFIFSAKEMKVWYEKYGFYIDSTPICCLPCRTGRRKSKELKQQYDSYPLEADGTLTPQQAKELMEIMIILFGDECSEKVSNRIRHISRIAKEGPNQSH